MGRCMTNVEAVDLTSTALALRHIGDDPEEKNGSDFPAGNDFTIVPFFLLIVPRHFAPPA
jgi:hypothetical protein